jgi:hypothetical protein
VGDVAVGEHHFVHAVLPTDRLELGLVDDGDALGIERTGQGRGVAAVGDTGDLGRGEGHHLGGGIVPIRDVEVVEVAAGGPHDDHSFDVVSHEPSSRRNDATPPP